MKGRVQFWGLKLKSVVKEKIPRPNIALLLVNSAAVFFYVIDHTLHSSNPQNP